MKKTGLFKILMFILLGIVIATWIFSSSYYYNGELSELGMKNIGFFDYFSLLIGSLEFEYFLQTLILLLAIGALYGVLNKTGKYRELVERIAKNLKGKEFITLVIISFLIAFVTAVFEYGFIAFIFVPFIISILLAIGYDKTTVFVAVFGSMLVGTIGCMFGPNTVGVTAELIETGNSDGLIYKYALFLFAFAAELFFLMKARNAKLAKADYDDMYLGETSTSKRTQKPIIVMLVILAVFTILACTSWKTMFGVEFFENIHATLTEWTIKLPHIHVTSDGFDVGTEKVAILSKLFGEISAFGNWYYSEMAVVCVIFALIIGRMYKIKSFEAMGEGAKKMIKPALMVTLAYTVIYFCGMEMFYPTIAKVILGLTKNFNVITSFISMVLGSILHVDILYVANYVAPQIMAQTGASTTTVAVLTQAVYGSMMFIAPTSAFLVFGLTYLNVPYKEYVKKVWKLALVFLGISLFVTFLADSFKDAESLKSLVAVYYISCLLIGVLNICSLWKVFKKAGKPGWASIIPIYNLIVMLQIADEPIWHIVFLIIPIYNIIYTFKLMIKFAKKFGASTAFGVLLVLMYPIFMTTLAFGNYKYKK